VRKLNEKLEKRVVERTVELEAANRELEAFAYSVSHDLRAPLRAVDGFSRILLDEYGPQLPAEAQHYLQVARDNALHMGDLIDGLLSFSRLGRQPIRKQLVEPADLVRQAVEDLGLEQAGRPVEIAVGYLPACEGDPLLLKQVFVNLLSNALKYCRTRERTRIEIATADSSAYYVRDNGVGFDMRYADKLFGVFQRLHRSEEYEGTGVGLAIVQRIVHRHGGRVWAEGVVNQGATFYFTLATAGAGGPGSDDRLPMEESEEKVRS
jgi:light-regulated signal transduction histidine kinase (bacteriophytochrome)